MIKLSPFLRQYACVIVVNLSVVSTGLGIAWSSPALVKLSNATSPILDEPLTEVQGSWIVAVVFLSALLSNIIASFLLDHLGRKFCVILAAAPKILGYLLILFAPNFLVLLFGRIFMGMTISFTYNSVPIYASEIASKEIRGSLGSVIQITSSLGIVMMFSIGPFLEYQHLNIMVLCLAIATSIPLLFLPDTPYSSFKKGQKDAAMKTLIFLRGSEEKAKEEMKEFECLKDSDHNHMNVAEIFKSRTVLKAIFIVGVINIFFQLTGVNVVGYYLQTILVSTNTKLSSEVASVIIGCIQLLSSIIATMIIDKFGRKVIIIACLLISALGLIGLGTFFKLTEESTPFSGFLDYLPVISLMLAVFGYSAGFDTLLWPLMSELFDGPARAIGVHTGTSILYLTVFILTRFFPNLTNLIGPAPTYWIFGGISVALSIFVLIVVPETKGKSFAEIQEALGGERR